MEITMIEIMLKCLGITPRYVGYSYVSYAVQLALEQPNTLSFVTKWLYPDVAKHFKTSREAVERNIRTVIGVAWKLHPDVLCQIAGQPLEQKPSNSQFLSILVTSIREIKKEIIQKTEENARLIAASSHK